MNDKQWVAVKQVLNIKNGETFFGGCVPVSITTEQMSVISELDLEDAIHKHNNAPAMKDFLQFVDEHQGNYQIEGYLYPPGRDKAAISIDAITGSKLDQSSVIDFANLFHKADEFIVGVEYARAWYD